MTTTSLAILLKVKIPGVAIPLYYQGYQSTPYFFDGDQYEPLGFEVQNYPNADLQLGADSVTIVIGNSEVIRSLLRQHNDLKRAVVTIYHVQPGTDVPPIGYKLMVSHATIDGAAILFSLSPPTSALLGSTNTKYLSARDFPEVPRYKPQF